MALVKYKCTLLLLLLLYLLCLMSCVRVHWIDCQLETTGSGEPGGSRSAGGDCQARRDGAYSDTSCAARHSPGTTERCRPLVN